LGSAKAVAREIGVTADSVNRYRRGARKHARTDVAAKIEDAVRKRWQPQVRKRRQRQAAATGGITVVGPARSSAVMASRACSKLRAVPLVRRWRFSSCV
jgi:DNA-binding transcriptional regulator YdaS (Cro superfamily)